MTIIELPYLFLGLLCFLLPFYWLTGLQNSGTEFFKFVLVGFLMVLFFSFMEQIYIAGLPNLIVAQALNGLFMSLFFAFGGLFIKPSGNNKIARQSAATPERVNGLLSDTLTWFFWCFCHD